MYMSLICPNEGGYLPFTSVLREVSGLLYSTSTVICCGLLMVCDVKLPQSEEGVNVTKWSSILAYFFSKL